MAVEWAVDWVAETAATWAAELVFARAAPSAAKTASS